MKNWCPNNKVDSIYGSFENYQSLPDVDYGESVVDSSKYRPNLPSFQQVSSGSSFKGLFDFSDGVDTGLDLTYLRKRGIDQTEIDAFAERLQNLTAEQVRDLQTKIAYDEIAKERKKQIKEASSALQSELSNNQSSNPSSTQ